MFHRLAVCSERPSLRLLIQGWDNMLPERRAGHLVWRIFGPSTVYEISGWDAGSGLGGKVIPWCAHWVRVADGPKGRQSIGKSEIDTWSAKRQSSSEFICWRLFLAWVLPGERYCWERQAQKH